ncbi:hypothetical protein D3C78_1658280 [compost metagenome]
MTPVFLMDRFYNCGVFDLIFVRNSRRPVGGAVIDNKQFNVLAARQKGFDAIAHIVLRIVARDRNR